MVYANEPYGDLNNCQVAGTAVAEQRPSCRCRRRLRPATKFTEAITDPELNSWFTAQGNEIGDLCAYDYGLFNNWDGGNANQMWNGRFYMLQTEYDNNQLGCVQVGP